MKNLSLASLTIVFITLLNTNLSLAQSVALDSTFGVTGIVYTTIDSLETGRNVLVQPDGKVLVSGNSFNSSTYGSISFMLIRYNSDGSYDNSFGSNGKVESQKYGFSGCLGGICVATKLQQDGKILQLNSIAFNSGEDSIIIIRYNIDGSLDNTFGSNGQIKMGGKAGALDIQGDGKILIGGSNKVVPGMQTVTQDFVLTRMDQNGSLDNTFGNNGVVRTDLGMGDFINSLTLQSDGKILASGYGYNNYELVRYNNDGTLDNTFGTSGQIITTFPSAQTYSCVLQSNGKILQGGSARFNNTTFITVIRFNIDGSVDSSFGVTGIDTVRAGGVKKIILQDDKIYFNRYSSNSNDYVIERHNSNGTPDNNFGIGSIANIYFGAQIYSLTNIALDDTGRILVTGARQYGLSPAYYHFLTARVLTGWNSNSPQAIFTGTPLTVTVGSTISFTNQSQFATSYSWVFAGGTPSSYNGLIPPPIQYNTVGTYDVTLSATDGVTTDVHTESAYIHVVANNVSALSGDPDIDFGNVVAPGYADHVYFFYNNSPNPITISTIQFPVNSGFGVQFVNGATVLPYQNLPVLLQFVPPLQQTYSATATVISNAPNNPITFHVTGIGTAQSISWIGVYNKPENNPEITQLEPLAENYITSNTQSTVKICADFSKATVVKFINNSGTIASSNIRFRMKSDPNGNNTDYTGWFITTDYSVVGNLVTARFTHPKYLNGNALYRVDTIQVVNSANNAVIYEHPARIYRAPVVLVHGLWGNAYSMQDIQYQLITSGKYNSTMVKVIDYESTNSYDYNTNSNVVKDGINNTLIGLRILKYSAGKVDIVAHSMGGILSRIYLQNPDCMGTPNNCYRSDIHKLITLNTPHSGTQVANFFLGNSNCAAIARLLLGQNGMNWSNGAVADLQCNSPAIAAMNSTPSLNRHIVPCRATATYTTPGPTTVLTNENALTNAIGVCRAESGLQFNNTVFLFTPNDLIVPDNSQIGGLSDYSYIANTMHTESPNSSSVISDLQVSLEENAATSSLFDGNIGGFNPPYISPTLKTNETDQDTHDGPRSGNITITNPSFGFSTTSGSTIQVSVTAASTINRIITTVGNIQTGIYSIDTTTNNFSFNYTVPTTVVGKISIVALGFDNSGLVDFDTIEIQSVPSIAPDSVKFVEEFIAVPKSRTTGFRLMGYFNGIQNDITELSGSTFSIDSTPIATITNVSNVYGADTGLTTLQGTYQGKSAYAYVKVYIGSDWVISFLNSPTDTNKSSNNFSIFPNPTTGIVNILCNKNNFKGSYSIFDVTGRKILSGNVSEKLFTIDLEKFSSGLYYLHVTDTEGKNQFQGKIIKG